MKLSYRPHARQGLRARRPLWLVFLFLTVVFFFNAHDISNAKRGIGRHDRSVDYLIATADLGSPPHRIALLSLVVFAIVSLAHDRNKAPFRINGPLGWILLVFVAWAFLSPIWAEDILLTLRRLMAFGILCIASLAVARRLSLREFVLWTCFTTSVFLLVSIVAEVVFGTFQPFASGYRFAGTLLPDGQGIECGLLVLSAVAAWHMEKHRRILFGACAFLGFVFLILSGSRTALFSTLLGLIVYLAAVWSRSTKVVALCGLSIVCSFLLLFFAAGLTSGLRSAVLLGRDDAASVDSFTGRTLLWTAVVHYVRQRPILGYGYGGFWTPTHMRVISDQLEWGVPDAHSAYFDCLLALGVVGLTAYVLVLSGGIKRAFRFRRLSGNPYYAFCGAILVFSALDGFCESAVIEGALLTFLCMVVLVRLAFIPSKQIRQVERETPATRDQASVAMASI